MIVKYGFIDSHRIEIRSDNRCSRWQYWLLLPEYPDATGPLIANGRLGGDDAINQLHPVEVEKWLLSTVF